MGGGEAGVRRGWCWERAKEEGVDEMLKRVAAPGRAKPLGKQLVQVTWWMRAEGTGQPWKSSFFG